jgi:hypothetical protein
MQMTSTIVDTSSLLSMMYANSFNLSRQYMLSDSEYISLANDITSGVEALVLFDDILVDKPSFIRAVARYPSLKKLGEFVGYVNECHSLEMERYKESVEYIIANTTPSYLLRNWLRNVSIMSGWNPHGTAQKLGGGIDMRFINKLREKLDVIILSEHTRITRGFSSLNTTDTQCVEIIRLFYYLTTQAIIGSHLSLQQGRANLLQKLPLDTPGCAPVGASVIATFHERVREAYQDRKKAWLGESPVSFRVPLLADYVLTRCREGERLLDIVLALRCSKEARRFRKEITFLSKSLSHRNGKDVDKVLSRLEIECDRWSHNLNHNPNVVKHCISISIPFIGIGVDLSFGMQKMVPQHGDAILIFIHKLISTASGNASQASS